MKITKRTALIIAIMLIGGGVLFLTLLTSAFAAAKTTCNVPTGPYPTIQSALDDTNCDIVNLTAPLYTEHLTIDRTLTIQGQGMDDTVIDGSNNGRVIAIQPSSAVTLTSLSVANGNHEDGGGIISEDSSLTLSNVAVINNTTPVPIYRNTGGIFIYANSPGKRLFVTNSRFQGNFATGTTGAIYLQHMDATIKNSVFISNESETCGAIKTENNFLPPTFKVNIENTLFMSNKTLLHGGAICNGYNMTIAITNSLITDNLGGGDGAGIWNDGTASLFHSAVSHNTTTGGQGAGIFNGQNAVFSLDSSTFDDNSATDQGEGGALVNYAGTMTIINSTISNNFARYGGGFYSDNHNSITTFLNSTLSGNSTSIFNGGGGIWALDGPLSLQNSIIANSPGGGDCFANMIVSNLNTLIEDGSCNASISGDPLLGPLQDNGGPTMTYALLEGSPAIDAGDNGICPTVDQRGSSRPLDGDGDGDNDCDIGAYEYRRVTNSVYLPALLKQ